VACSGKKFQLTPPLAIWNGVKAIKVTAANILTGEQVLANLSLAARFGVTFVDYEHGQERHAKKSARVIGQVFNALIRKD
jgi:hypothetical protein